MLPEAFHEQAEFGRPGAVQTDRLIAHQYLTTARAHFKNIVLTRRWNAQHGGVFVQKGPENPSNPYLKNPDITAKDGTVYTMKNPALMTREISELARQSGDFVYHSTSITPLNPDNAPDDAMYQAKQTGRNRVVVYTEI